MESISYESLWQQAENIAKSKRAKRQGMFTMLFSILFPVVLVIAFSDYFLPIIEKYFSEGRIGDNVLLGLFLPIAVYVIIVHSLSLLIFSRKVKQGQIEEKFKELISDRESELRLEIDMLQKDIKHREEELTKRQALLTQLCLVKEDGPA